MNKIAFNAFGFPLTKEIKTKADQTIRELYGLELDPKTGSTHIVKTGEVDTQKEIQTFKDSCGMSLALDMIGKGYDPAQFADDGKHGGDFTRPTAINEAYQSMLSAKTPETAALDSDKIQELIDKKVKEALAAAQAAAVVPEGEGK